MSTTYTTNYHLGKQEDTSDNFNMSVITDNMDTIDSVLGNKSDKSSTYTKTEVDAALSVKQNTISDLATIRSGAALGATAVQPETGKGLSTNDYTTTEKTKLAGIAEGAEVNEIESIKVNNTTINPDVNKVVNITVPTSAADVSALPDTTKYAVALSLTINSSTFVMTGQLKDQNGDNLGTAQTIDLPLESVVVGGSYNSQTKNVVLTLQNGNTIEFSVADLVSGLQTELSASNKLNPAYIDYDSTHRAVSDTEKSTWNSKQNAIDSSHKLSADLVDDTNATNKFATAEELEQIETNKNNISTDRATLAELVDGGAKNLFNVDKIDTTGTYNADYDIVNGKISVSTTGSYGRLSCRLNLPAGAYKFTTLASDINISGGIAEIRIVTDVSGSGAIAVKAIEDGECVIAFTLATEQPIFLMFYLNRSSSSYANSASFEGIMLCTKAAWDISQKYVPYRPSYDELIARVEALEQAAGINSVRSMVNLTTETVVDTTETEGEELR